MPTTPLLLRCRQLALKRRDALFQDVVEVPLVLVEELRITQGHHVFQEPVTVYLELSNLR